MIVKCGACTEMEYFQQKHRYYNWQSVQTGNVQAHIG